MAKGKIPPQFIKKGAKKNGDDYGKGMGPGMMPMHEEVHPTKKAPAKRKR